ncbi:MAG: isocitrate lyase/phosphoenolpyruvate mutase family protein [Candidatus Promineofilum sp.]|nr:isocitrate lyase/phosphoenolpyruvate mutase family protein [Promineifilum sp.]
MQTQIQQAQRFRALHDRGRVLLLPNAWDAGSARIFANLGFDAVATTSAGVAWALGYPDGEVAPLDEVLAVIRRIVRVTPLPVSVDFEAGFGDTPEAVAANVRRVIDTGAVGLNLEDGIRHEHLRPIDDAARRVAAARQAAVEAGVPIVINARVDTWMVGSDAGEDALVEEALRRARAYLEAGADCIYPIGLSKPDVIARLCAAIDAPVNIGVRPGLPPLAELGRLGVARVSAATRLATVAFAAARDAAKRLQDSGRFDGLDSSMNYGDINRLFT